MEEHLKRSLCTNTLRLIGTSSGCISNGKSYETDNRRIFVKHNTDSEAKLMFDGEYASLEALYNTSTVRVPKPLKVIPDENGKGLFFVMEHLDIAGLDKHQATLGEQLARLHLHNLALKQPQSENKDDVDASSRYISKFGFQCPTACGLNAMPNDWEESWMEFYISKRLEPQLELVRKKYGQDDEAKLLWEKLKPKIPALFEGILVEPALLHGDLWAGNCGETREGPVVYDPASFYGHHEFDLAIAGMFGGFTRKFYDAYHCLIPKAQGFSTRQKLYQLFHYINHWNLFGGGYRSQSIALMRELSQ